MGNLTKQMIFFLESQGELLQVKRLKRQLKQTNYKKTVREKTKWGIRQGKPSRY